MHSSCEIRKPTYKAAFIASIYVLLIVVIYHPVLKWLIIRDWQMDDYSHCMLVPFIVMYLVWTKRESLISHVSVPSLTGIFIVILGAVLFLIGELAGEYYTLYLSLWVVVFGLLYLNMGWVKIRIILFPIVFSLSMFPFPHYINNRITLQLKLVSTDIGVMLLRAYGMSAFSEGNVIDLGFTKLQVVDACSGLRYLFPMLVLSILVAYLYKIKLWKKIIIVISSIPLTIMFNSLRIAITGILAEKFGVNTVVGFFHDFEGWMIFMISVGFLCLEIWVLNFFYPENRRIESECPEGVFTDSLLQNNYQEKNKKFFPYVAFSILILIITFAFSKNYDFRETMPLNKSFGYFPLNQGKWVGVRQTMEQRFIDSLELTDYFMADYKDEKGKIINLYVAYYDSQRKGGSIHSPASCLRANGWVFEQTIRKQIDMGDKDSIIVNRAMTKKDSIKEVVFYWFPSRGRILTNELQMKFYNFYDALTRRRTDGALVRITSLVYPNESLENSEKRVADFISCFNPYLNEYLPK